MIESCTLLLLPEKLQRLADELGKPELKAEMQPHLDAYLEQACKPLLATPPGKREDLPSLVSRFAMASLEARLMLLATLYNALGQSIQEFLSIGDAIPELIPEFRGKAGSLLSPEACNCFEMGIRVYARSSRRLAALARQGKFPPSPPAGDVTAWYEWIHIAGCLDLCTSSVVWYLDHDALPARAGLVEELCRLVKEYALAHVALATFLVPPSDHPKASRPAGIAVEDAKWDRDFCSLVLPDLAARLE